ncbi:hypothetical protein DYBT9275_00900 [Dyadobacter sp. CECT 9275]|uniref:Uncharacterized protein n=1 Tax=Dyadobacter helix TaxID=2822344 RepID=A0A916J9A0_9BACT|nr:hypothetical protein [Dyadobacter sp. CECT 9275]CAG4992132.1 hypothetical protein DYBT9275_00900 [Dyadobacter sp. CECT 9275]
MLKFQSEDQQLVIHINGMTKKPENLSQDELQQMQKNGDRRITEDQPAAEVSKKKPASIEA